jgi:hypothetical protein
LAVLAGPAGERLQPVAGQSYSLLRPEAIESALILWRVTRKEEYRHFGWRVFQAIQRYSRRSRPAGCLRSTSSSSSSSFSSSSSCPNTIVAARLQTRGRGWGERARDRDEGWGCKGGGKPTHLAYSTDRRDYGCVHRRDYGCVHRRDYGCVHTLLTGVTTGVCGCTPRVNG